MGEPRSQFHHRHAWRVGGAEFVSVGLSFGVRGHVLVLGALRERVAPHGDRGGDEAHQDHVYGAVLRAPHHAERDPAAGSAVMERRAVYAVSIVPSVWMKGFCRVPAAGLVRVAGSTITGRIGNKEMGIKLNPSASRTPQASFFDPAASLRCRTVCETGADRCRACGPSTLVSGDVTSAE